MIMKANRSILCGSLAVIVIAPAGADGTLLAFWEPRPHPPAAEAMENLVRIRKLTGDYELSDGAC